MGRTAMGVNAIKLRKGDEVTGMVTVPPENDGDLLVITSKGMGKRTPLSEYAARSRYGSGIRTLTKDIKYTGHVVAARRLAGSYLRSEIRRRSIHTETTCCHSHS